MAYRKDLTGSTNLRALAVPKYGSLRILNAATWATGLVRYLILIGPIFLKLWVEYEAE